MSYKRFSTYLWTFGSRILVIGLTAAFGILSARLLGPADKGTYTVAILIPSVVSTIAMLAGPQLIVMDVSKSRIPGVRLHKLLNWSAMLAVTAACISLAIQLATSSEPPTFSDFLTSGAVFIAVALVVSEFYGALLQAWQQFKALALFRIMQVLLPGVSMMGGLIILGLEGAILCYSFGILIMGLFSWCMWDRSFEHQEALSKGPHKIPWVYVVTTNTTLLFLFLSYRVDILILNAISTTREVGIYSAAVALAELVLVASMSIAVVRAPVYAGDRSRSLKNDTWKVFGLSSLAAVGISIISPIAIPLLFGVEYLDSVEAIWLLLPGICLLAVYRYISNAEIVRGHKFGVLISCLLSVIVDVGILILLGQEMGARGASLAASFAYACGLAYLLTHRRLRKPSGMDPIAMKQSAQIAY